MKTEKRIPNHERIWDIAVVGKGMMGSATAKYLARNGKNVLLIGANEPQPGTEKDALVFSSHYDEGRVLRIRGTDETWTRLNLESSKAYGDLTKETGLNFHSPVGCLYVSTYPGDSYFEDQPDVKGFSGKIGPQILNNDELKTRFPDFHFPEGVLGYYESGPAGRINPRGLVKAQTLAFENSGGFTLPETVLSVDSEQNHYELKTNSGKAIRAEKLVLATGSFANFFDILPSELSLELKGENVILAAVSGKEALRLNNLPCLLYEIETREYEGIYVLGPVRYPDGKVYVKMGCNLPEDLRFSNLSSVQTWFRNDRGSDHIGKLTSVFRGLMPGVRFDSFISKRCIISRTPHKKPYIGLADGKGLFVATGGNGYSAMCSDALGWITANLALNGEFPEGYREEDFRLILRS